MRPLDRRTWIKATAFSALTNTAWAAENALPVAGIVTVYRENSHADVILGKILGGFDQKGGPGPRLKLISLYTDQINARDMSRSLSRRHGFRLAKTIDEAITLGTASRQVAGVISIGEHGDYPYTEDTKQHMYPRRRFFDAITAAFERCGSVAPVFNDKHLAYRWKDARHMYDTAKRLKIPFLAGSSLPVTWRHPPLVLPRNCEIKEAMAIGYGGNESYGFHALETLQCMIERRKHGETGVDSVRVVRGEQIWEAERRGEWSRELFRAALRTMPDVVSGDARDRLSPDAAFFLIRYRDGLKATVAMANGVSRHFGFSAALRGESKPRTTWFKLEDNRPFGHFTHLVKAIERTVHTQKPAYPVERTLLTTGILDAVMRSLALDGKLMTTPELGIRYGAGDWAFANAGNTSSP